MNLSDTKTVILSILFFCVMAIKAKNDRISILKGPQKLFSTMPVLSLSHLMFLSLLQNLHVFT